MLNLLYYNNLSIFFYHALFSGGPVLKSISPQTPRPRFRLLPHFAETNRRIFGTFAPRFGAADFSPGPAQVNPPGITQTPVNGVFLSRFSLFKFLRGLLGARSLFKYYYLTTRYPVHPRMRSGNQPLGGTRTGDKVIKAFYVDGAAVRDRVIILSLFGSGRYLIGTIFCKQSQKISFDIRR